MPSPIMIVQALLAITVLAMAPTFAQSPSPPPDIERWPVLVQPFESTGGGGIMIDGYAPTVADGQCRSPFTARTPDGTLYRNTITFEAVPVAGGIWCRGGRWRALDGSAEGETPFELFIRDGIVRRNP